MARGHGDTVTEAKDKEILRDTLAEDSVTERGVTVVKVAKPKQDVRFDVPIVGMKTIETMQTAGATCLALDAGKCLLLGGAEIIAAADAAGVAIVADSVLGE